VNVDKQVIVVAILHRNIGMMAQKKTGVIVIAADIILVLAQTAGIV
jgi:hypothetical protein